MALRDVVEKVPVRATGSHCATGRLIEKLNKDDRAVLLELLADDSKPSTWIAMVLKEDGHAASEHSVNRHRRGKCLCGTA